MITSVPVRCPKCGKTIGEFVGPLTFYHRRGVGCTFSHGWVTCDCGERVEMDKGQIVERSPSPKCEEVQPEGNLK